MAAPRITLLHEAHDGPAPPPAGRAAFGEGSAARDVLLDFLQVRDGLLQLRRASRGARLLVSECRFSDIRQSAGLLVATKPQIANALANCFPRWTVALRISDDWYRSKAVCVASQLRVHAQFLDEFMVPFSEAHLLALPCHLERVRIANVARMPSHSLSVAGIGRLATVTHLDLSWVDNVIGWSSTPLAFSFRSIAALPSLTHLSLAGFSSVHLSLPDLLPCAPRLTALKAHHCEGVRDFAAFTALRTLEFAGGGLSAAEEAAAQAEGRQGLPVHVHLPPSAIPSSLRCLSLAFCELGPAWAAIGSMQSLEEVTLDTVSGPPDALLQHLPPTVHSLTVLSRMTLTPSMLATWGHLRRVKLGRGVVVSDAKKEVLQAAASCLAGLQSLELHDGEHGLGPRPLDLLCLAILPPLMPALHTLILPTARWLDLFPELLHQAPALQELAVDFTSPPDAPSMAEAVCTAPTLRSLAFTARVRGTTPAFVQAIHEALADKHGPLLRLWVACRWVAASPPVGEGVWHRVTQEGLQAGTLCAGEPLKAQTVTVRWSLPPAA